MNDIHLITQLLENDEALLNTLSSISSGNEECVQEEKMNSNNMQLKDHYESHEGTSNACNSSNIKDKRPTHEEYKIKNEEQDSNETSTLTRDKIFKGETSSHHHDEQTKMCNESPSIKEASESETDTQELTSTSDESESSSGKDMMTLDLESFHYESDDDMLSYPKTEHEIDLFSSSINLPFEYVPEDYSMKAIGTLHAIIDKILVVQSFPNSIPLDFENILITEGRLVLGSIIDIFGPVKSPAYSLIVTDKILSNLKEAFPLYFNAGSQKEKEENVPIIYYCPNISKPINTEEIAKIKGSDASNLYNEEPNDNEIEYSDDEVEKFAKAMRKKRHHQQPHTSAATSKENKDQKKDNDTKTKSLLHSQNFDSRPLETYTLLARPAHGSSSNKNQDMNELLEQESNDYLSLISLDATVQKSDNQPKGSNMLNNSKTPTEDPFSPLPEMNLF